MNSNPEDNEFIVETAAGKHVYVHESRLSALTARCEALEAALLKYGYHHESCDFVQSELPCTCGLEVLRSSVADPGCQS